MGEAALLCGDRELALGALGAAAGEPPAGPAALLLVQALLCEGALEDARALAGRLVQDAPEAALGLMLADLAGGRPVALEVDLDQASVEQALRSWVATLRGAARPEVLAALRRGAPTLREAFPWLPGVLGTTAA